METRSLAWALVWYAFVHPVAMSATDSCPKEAKETARFTVRVLDEKEKPAKEFKDLETVNGRRVRQLRREQSGTTVELPVGGFVALRFSSEEATGFEITPPGILEAPTGPRSMPRGLIGMLRAIGPGTATITVKKIVPKEAEALPKAGTAITGTPWSGYVVPGGPFTSIRGRWIVPTVRGDGGSASATWIGIDGSDNMSLIQTGTEQDYSCDIFSGCSAHYYPWYQVLPQDQAEIPIPQRVSPGDEMLASITIGGDGKPNPGSPMIWTILLEDTSAGWSSFSTVSYSGMLDTAEWIEEATTTCSCFLGFICSCGVANIADYGSVTFDVGDLMTPGGDPNFNFATESSSISQSFNGGTICSTPSSPDADGDGFTVAFTCGQPSPPGPFITTTSLPNGAVNRNYFQQLQVSGDASPQWQLVSGSLTPLNLSSSGAITGTPNATSTLNFTVQATDANNPGAFSQMQPLSITILQTEPPPDFQLTAGPIVLQGGAYPCSGSTTISITPINGFTGNVAFSASNVPAGASEAFVAISPQASRFTLSSSPHCWLSTTQVTVTGVSANLSHQVQVPVQVLPPHHGK